MPFDVWPDDLDSPVVADRSKVAFTFETIVSGNNRQHELIDASTAAGTKPATEPVTARP